MCEECCSMRNHIESIEEKIKKMNQSGVIVSESRVVHTISKAYRFIDS